jgi:hypothetical protein
MGFNLTPICPADRGKNWIFLWGEQTSWSRDYPQWLQTNNLCHKDSAFHTNKRPPLQIGHCPLSYGQTKQYHSLLLFIHFVLVNINNVLWFLADHAETLMTVSLSLAIVLLHYSKGQCWTLSIGLHIRLWIGQPLQSFRIYNTRGGTLWWKRGLPDTSP